MKSKNLNILIAGTGGQGVLFASNIAASACMNAGHDVKVSVARGISKRGGSVCGHVRIGQKVYSPIISRLEADILIGLDPTETKRWKKHLKKDGIFIALGAKGASRQSDNRRFIYPNKEVNKNLKDPRAANVFMLGAVSNFVCCNTRPWIKAIKEFSPAQNLKDNIEAFKKGQKQMQDKKNGL